MKKFKLTFLALAALSLMASLPALAATPSAFVMKVEIFNAPDVEPSAPGLRNMIASRVAGEGYTVGTGDAPGPNARWKLRTTITKLGGVYSIDSAIESLVPGGDGGRTFEKVNSFDDLMGALEKTSDRMRTRLEQLATATSAPQPKTAAAVASQPTPTPSPISRVSGNFLAKRKKLFTTEGETTAMTVADIDPTPGDEIILLVEGNIVVLASEGSDKMKELFSFDPDVFFTPVSISAGDIDGDGIIELFMVGKNDTRVFTQAYTVKNNVITPKGDYVGGYLRIVKHPDEGDKLIGNPTLGGSRLFSRNIYNYGWHGEGYAKGDEITVPSSTYNINSININWVRFAPGTEGLWFTMLDNHNRLRIYDTTEEVKEAYSAETVTGGTRVSFIGEMRDVKFEEEGDFWEIDPAPAPVMGPDGNRYIIIHDNIEESSLMPRRWGSYSSGTLTALNWDGMALQTGAKSAEYEGFFASYATGKAPDGTQRLFVVLITEEGMMMVDQTTHLLAFDF